jgi:hypothetical protein
MNYLLAIVAFIGWAFVLDYRKQNKFLLAKTEGYRNALQSFIRAWTERGEEIERLKKCTKVCEFSQEIVPPPCVHCGVRAKMRADLSCTNCMGPKVCEFGRGK